MPRRLVVSGRGWGLLATGSALLAGGAWLRYPGVVGLGLALVSLLVVSVAGVLLPAPLRVRRSVSPERVTRLGSATGTLEIANVGRWAIRVVATDAVAGQDLPVPVPVLLGKASTRADFDVPATVRGRVPTGPVRIERRGLADLATARSVHGERVDVVVLPRVLTCRGLPAGVRRGHAGADERVLAGGTDLVGLREYVPGDDLRRLHAATSARTGRLMVREDADPGRPHLTVLLDDRPTSFATADDFEEAADVAASLVAAATRGGHPTRLVTASGAADVDLDAPAPGAASGAGLDRVRQALADLGAPAATGELTGGRARVSRHEPDVLAVVSGVSADLGVLRQAARGAQVGCVLLVDPRPERPVRVAGSSVVLSGPRAEDLLRGWDLAVVR